MECARYGGVKLSSHRSDLERKVELNADVFTGVGRWYMNTPLQAQGRSTVPNFLGRA